MGEVFVKRAWWAGPVTGCGRRAGGDCCAGFPRRCRVSCRRAAVGQAGAPAAVAPVRAWARTNELDAGERRPMIGGEEQPASRLWLPGRGCWGGSPELCGLAEWVSQPPIRPPAWAGAMTMSSGARAAQSVRRARRGRLRMIYELARAGRPFRARHGAAVGGVAGCGAAGCSASVSRCQARVSSLRATAVVAIFFPRRLAMAWTGISASAPGMSRRTGRSCGWG